MKNIVWFWIAVVTGLAAAIIGMSSKKDLIHPKEGCDCMTIIGSYGFVSPLVMILFAICAISAVIYFIRDK